MLFKSFIIKKIVNKKLENKIDIKTVNCVNYNTYISNCNLCTKLCPSNAIELIDIPEINYNKCIECGFCTNFCKFDVFSHKDYKIENILYNIKQIGLKNNNILFTCSQNKIQLTDNIVKLPCLSMLTPAIYLYTLNYIHDSIYIDISNCNDCEIGHLIFCIKNEIQIVEDITSSLNIKKIKTIISKEEFNNIFRFNNLNTREFLNDLKNDLKNRNKSLLYEIFDKKNENDKYQRDNPPFSHKLLNYSIIKLEKSKKQEISTKNYILPDIKIDADKCIGCISCEEVCITDAISAFRTEKEITLNFSSYLCIHCGLCKTICKNNALSFNKKNTYNDIREKKVFELIKFKKKYCEKCNEIYYTSKDQSICHICREENMSISKNNVKNYNEEN